jgi:WD40 repeat protein
MMAFDPRGRYLAACGDSGLAVWSVDPGDRPLRLMKKVTGERTRTLAFHPTEDQLAWVVFSRNTLRTWDLASASLGAAVPEVRLSNEAGGIGFTPDGRHLAFIGASGTAEFWDVARGSRAFSFGSRAGAATGVATAIGSGMLSPDGSRLAWASGRDVSVWDVGRRAPLVALPQERSTPWMITWAPDDQRLALGYSDGGMAMWDLRVVRSQLRTLGLSW